MSPYTSLSCCRCCVLLNSPSHLVTATDDSSIRIFTIAYPSPEVYGSILPSSFTRVLSSALVFLYPTTCVGLGLLTCNLKLKGFSWKRGISDFRIRGAFVSGLSVVSPDFAYTATTYFFTRTTVAWPPFSVPSRLGQCRNINLLPIDYAFRPHLGADSPLPD